MPRPTQDRRYQMRGDGATVPQMNAIFGWTGERMALPFREACREAGVNKSAHGVRKIGATRAAENGATDAELEALFGWERGSGMAALYTEAAERAKLAKGAVVKMLPRTSAEQSIPAPDEKVRGKSRTREKS